MSPTRRRPREPDRHLVPGERAVRELVDGAPARVRQVLCASPPRGLVEWLSSRGVRVSVVDRAELDRVIGPNVHRGVLAEADPPPMHDLAHVVDDAVATEKRQVLVALDGVQDPHNLGAIMRSAEFFGAAGLFWPKDRSVGLTPAVVRASAGASERLRLSVVTNLTRALLNCKERGMWVVGTVIEGGQPLGELAADPDLPNGLVVVFGAEHRGLRRLTRETCDFLVTLPPRGAIGSLNVSAAAAVTLAALA